MNKHERELFNAIRDTKPESLHWKSKVDFTPKLADWLAQELSKNDTSMMLTQRVYIKGMPYEIVGRMRSHVDVALITLSEILKSAGIPGISASDIDRLQPPVSMQTFEVVASIDLQWGVTIMSNHSGSALDGAVRRWCAGLGLVVSMKGET
jgi:hypothetical protein